MCRMVGLLSAEPGAVGYELLAAPHSLFWLSQNGKQPYRDEGGPHGDGWGFAWRQEGEMRLVKKGKPAFTDPEFGDWASRIKSDLLIAHARKASLPQTVCDNNSHPFRRGEVLFAHNGDIRFPQEGEVDSKLFLDWLEERWDRSEEGLASLLKQARTSFSFTSLTFLMTTGDKLYALREVRDREKYLKYYTLYLKQEPGKVVLASEPLDDGEWNLVENSQLLVVEAPGRVRGMSLR